MTAEIWDVIIVGAGLSGLSAAHSLKKRNSKLRILILEGKDRVGGRTETKDLPAASGVDRWDVGGQWVGSTQTHIMELIQEMEVEVYPQYNTGKKVHHMGGLHGKVRTYSASIPTLSPLLMIDFTRMLWKIDRLCATVCVEDPSRTPNAVELDSMTVHSYLEQHAWTRELKELMGLSSRAVFGMEPSQMSFLYFLMYAAAAGGLLALLESTPGSAQEFKVKGGAQQLSECLAERVGWENVRLGSAVMAIWQDGEWANVKTAKHSFLCKAVIVTCPPHLAAKIQYEPALPKQRECLTQNMPVGHLIKFIVTYQTAFWRENGFSGEIVAQPYAECPISVTYDATTPSSNPALVGFIAGQQASQWGCREAEERREAVVASLVRYLGPEAASFIHYEEKLNECLSAIKTWLASNFLQLNEAKTEVLIVASDGVASKDWAKEDYSGGCPVNVMAPGLLTYYHPSLRTPCGRIHWAGTETATRWCGYMSGAVQAGQRAALEVLADLCPFTLTQKEREEAQLQNKDTNFPAWLTSPESSKFTYLGRAVLVATVSVSAALLLAHHQLCQKWIAQGRGLVWIGLTKYNVFRW